MTNIVTTNGYIEISKDGEEYRQYPFGSFRSIAVADSIRFYILEDSIHEHYVEKWGSLTIDGTTVTKANYRTALAPLF